MSVLSLFGEQITADIQGVFMGKWRLKGKKKLRKYTAVSYTHLDVYKRQVPADSRKISRVPRYSGYHYA